MKKIFAIALALVMVLSMASAFAACPTINWACSTSVCTDGKGSVEVIPFVKGNACGGNSWTANTCAGAINNDNVYAAIKVTVEENPNMDWWNQAALTVTVKGMKANTFGAAEDKSTGAVYTNGNPANLTNFTEAGELVEILTAGGDKAAELEAGVYYIVPHMDGDHTSGKPVDAFEAIWAKDFEAKGEQLFTATVADASAAKFCAYLKSSVDASAGAWYSVGDYFIKWDNGDIQVSDKTSGFVSRKRATFDINGSDLIEKVTYEIWDASGNQTTNKVLTGFGFVDANGASVGTCDPYAWLAKAMEYLKLDFRATCYTAKAFKANFGWEDKFESCFSWSDKVQSVVDAECVVAIPKTGDKSVLAWLF